MPVKLQDIEVDAIDSLEEAKGIIKQQRNSFEQLFQLYEKQRKEILQLQQEIARLKKQPKKPQFSSASYAAPKQSEKNGKQWQKEKRGNIEVDQRVTLPEIDI